MALTGPGDASRDRGSVLVITLVLVVVMAAIALGLARYAATGLRSSSVTNERTAGTAATSAGIYWVLDEFAKKRLGECTDSNPDPDVDYSVPSAPPSAVVPSGATVALSCSDLGLLGGHPAFRIVADTTLSTGYTTTVTVDVQVPNDLYIVQVANWVES
jgi:hypothetical protein